MQREHGTLDRVDLEILRGLRTDGRIRIGALAERVHMSRANVYDRLARMRRSGALRSFTVDVDPQAVGMGVTAVVLLRGGQRSWRQFRDELADIDEVEYAALVMGAADAVVIVRVPTVEALRDLIMERLQALPSIGSTETLMVMEEVVHRPFVLPADG